MSMKIGNTNVFIMFKNIKKLRKHVINVSTQFGNLYDFAFKVGGGDAPPFYFAYFSVFLTATARISEVCAYAI